jgi:hypothetical protein
VTSRQRIVLLALAAVVLVGGIALASLSGGDDEPSSASETTAQQAPETGTTGSGTTGAEEPAEEEPPPAPKPRVETIEMEDRAPVGEPQTLEYERGETIRLRFRSDVAEEVHIHGFDRYVDVPAGGTKTERFEASLEGIFEVESHGSGELLAKLQISPK